MNYTYHFSCVEFLKYIYVTGEIPQWVNILVAQV